MRNILAPILLFSRHIFGAKSSFRAEYFGARSYSTALLLECVESAVCLLLGFSRRNHLWLIKIIFIFLKNQ
jgi:hypothetical protein